MALLETDTLSNQNIYNGGLGLLIGTHILTIDRAIAIEVLLDQIAGDGDYSVWVARQAFGAGSFYKSMVTTETVPAGDTAKWFSTIYLRARATDVIRVYVLGQDVVDLANVDTRVEFWDDPTERLDVPATGDVVVGEMLMSALSAFFSVDTGSVFADAVPGSVVHEIPEGIVATVFPAGAIEYTYTVTDVTTGLPIEGVEVWFSTDIGGVNIVWKGETDAFGIAMDVNGDLPWLDAGTYYVWCQRTGYAFTNPDTEIVS